MYAMKQHYNIMFLHCVYKTISFNLVYKTSVKLNSKQYTQQFVLFKFGLNFIVEKCETTISYVHYGLT